MSGQTHLTPHWAAKEAARFWINANPRGAYFPQPLTVIFERYGGVREQASVTSQRFGVEPPLTLELPINAFTEIDKARDIIRLAVHKALGVKQWVEDGRHLMNESVIP